MALAAMPDAKSTAAEAKRPDGRVESSLTQQFISQPKKLMGSWGIFSGACNVRGILKV